MKSVYLLTGKPGVGKTSLIKQVVTPLKEKGGGFYTLEIREHDVRQGFKIITLDGQEGVLSHIEIKSPYRVSKYGVDISVMDNLGVPALKKAAQERELVVIDEIGKMELFSSAFRDTVAQLVDNGTRIIGTIMLNSSPYTDTIKKHPNVNVITLPQDNYQQVLVEIQDWLKNNQTVV